MTARHTDLDYGHPDGLGVDLYVPAQANGAAIVDVHGGGFFRGDKDKDADLGAAFAAAGYLVAIPNYRLAPAHRFPAPVDDLLRLLDWLAASDWAFDRRRVGAFGSSAGGNLAIELALRRGMPAVSWSGIIEIDDWLATHRELPSRRSESLPGADAASATIDQSGRDDPFYKWFLLNYLGAVGSDASADARARDASVLHRVRVDAGPMLLVNSLDEFVPVGGVLRLQQALTTADVPSVAQFISGSRHAKGYLAEAMAETLLFFQRHLLPAAAAAKRAPS